MAKVKNKTSNVNMDHIKSPLQLFYIYLCSLLLIPKPIWEICQSTFFISHFVKCYPPN